MAFANPLLERWAAGGVTLGGWMTTADPQVAEFLASCGFDEVCVDQQHGLADARSIAGAFRSIELHGAVPTTRVPANEPALIGISLDLGALGVVIPMVESAEEAARAVAACRYAPHGHRSAGPLRGGIVRGEGGRDDHERVAVVAMVETASGLRNVDGIAGTPGVDAVYIGPADLALSLGLSWDPADWSPSETNVHRAAIEAIRVACARHDVTAGIHCANGAAARSYIEQGFRMLTVTSDLGLLKAGGLAELQAARGATDQAQSTEVAV